jgi:hypothetical protein
LESAAADALAGIGAANGVEMTTLDEGGWLDPAATDRLLESAAAQLGVAVDALGSKDVDMFLPYHAPRSLLGSYDAPSASLALLRSYAATLPRSSAVTPLGGGTTTPAPAPENARPAIR